MVKNAPDRIEEQKSENGEKATIEVVHDADEVVHDAGSDHFETDDDQLSEELENIPETNNLDLNSFENLSAPEFEAPFYARYRLLSVTAIILTLFWLVASLNFLFNNLTLADISQLLPHELGGIAAGIVTPIALMWIVVAFFEKTRIYQVESQALKWHLAQLTYPSDSAESRVAEITQSLRAQTVALTYASQDVGLRASNATDLIRRQTSALALASEEATTKADSAGNKLRQQAEDLVNASDQAIARAREAGNVLHHQSQLLFDYYFLVIVYYYILLNPCFSITFISSG